ncbi:MraZ protein [Formivibrio citricus]|uniref:Transcriptional regulator MraZ n=1 Tax=Formivibrio citricus TaxID=83765 RepID=A0A1I4VNG5_9NEIS|nr:division/cell wall cluster transcriptional repressor MraZ [Formivibrio citricus]SFN02635.1 MraZ protein [Formivibrio citricus]
MFSGVSTLNLDSKGRLAIPAKHRELLSAMSESRIMITLNPEGCLLIYPKTEWQPIYEQLRKLSGAQAAVARVIVGFAEELELDSAGRVLVPTKLRERAGLDKEVALVGMGNKFELWDDARWNAKVDAVMAIDPVSLADQMQGIVL